jgi:hypothetical protein
MPEDDLIVSEDFQNEYKLLTENMAAFVGCRRTHPSRVRRWESNFGGPKLSITVDDELINYIWNMPSKNTVFLPIFDSATLKKWNTVAVFACGKYVNIKDINGISSELVDSSLVDREHLSSIAALAGFPLLEDIARKISKKWDSNGRIIEELDKGTYNLSRTYKVGQLISSFRDKMQIMLSHLPDETKTHWAQFNRLTQHPDMPGIAHDPIPPIFERLHNRRNSWAHGQEFEGEEGIIISLIIKFIYLHCLVYKIQSNNI